MILISPSVFGTLGLLVGSALGIQEYLGADTSPTHQPIKSNSVHLPPGHLGAVASESEVCSRIGTDLLKHGGNAADAMVGTTFCTGVIGMYHSGIGGGGFMLIRTASGDYESVDFRETAPANSSYDMYNGNVFGSVFGGLAVAVPGEVKGMHYLHQKYGKLPWHQVLRGAVDVARNGFPVTADLVRYINATLSYAQSNFLLEDPNWSVDFAPNGTMVELGDIITRKRYANTLEQIALHGPDVFYSGPMAEEMISTIQSANGTMTLSDLANYTVELRRPVSIDYRGYKLHSCAAPASGAIVFSALKILEGYPDLGETNAVNLSTHRITEAMRFAYGQRTTLGDPSFVSNTSEFEANILSKHTTSLIRNRILDTTTLPVAAYNPSGLEPPASHGTSHVVTSDASGLSISMTTTVNLLFGAQIITPNSGIILNDEMNDFSIPGRRNQFDLPPSPSNYIAPFKRPLSSITPVIVEHSNGSVYFITGAAGGSRIITATLLSLYNVLDRGMGVQEALKQGRWHDQLIPNEVSFELSIDEAILAGMRERGHKVVEGGAAGASSVQAIRVKEYGENGGAVFEAAGEPRQKGSAGLVV